MLVLCLVDLLTMLNINKRGSKEEFLAAVFCKGISAAASWRCTKVSWVPVVVARIIADPIQQLLPPLRRHVFGHCPEKEMVFCENMVPPRQKRGATMAKNMLPPWWHF